MAKPKKCCKKKQLSKKLEGDGILEINTSYIADRNQYTYNYLIPSSNSAINLAFEVPLVYPLYLSGDTQLFGETDEYAQNVYLRPREKILNAKKSMAVIDYINQVGSVYRTNILKFIKRNMEKTYPVGEQTISFIDTNIEPGKQIGFHHPGGDETNYYGKIPPPEKFEGQELPYYVVNMMNRDNRSESGAVEYGRQKRGNTREEIEKNLEAEKKLEMDKYKAFYKNKVKSVNTALFNGIRSQVTDNPNNPSLIIPSPIWINGEAIEVEGNIDLKTTLPENYYDELLATQKAFEREIFNSKVEGLKPLLIEKFKTLDDEFKLKSKYIPTIEDAFEGKLGNKTQGSGTKSGGFGKQTHVGVGERERAPTDPKYENAFRAEYDRQIKNGDSFSILDVTGFNRQGSWNTEAILGSSEAKFSWVTKRARDFTDGEGRTAFENWLISFITSEEYNQFIRQEHPDTFKEIDDKENEIKEKMNPTVDTKKLGETKTFFNAEVLESEDTDGVNTDLIDKLKKQEEDYNKVIADLKAPFEKEQADQQIKNNEALEALRAKIASVDASTFKQLDEGMAINKQNRVERQKQDAEREIAERTKEDKDGALASLKNYESCATKPVKETPERVFQDVNLQDVIAQSGRQLAGGRKKNNSIANQVYLLNKRFVDSNGFESPLVRTNSARKKGGATNMSNEPDPLSELGIQGDTTNYLNTSGLEDEIAWLDAQEQGLGFAEMGVGLIPVVGDLLSAVMTIGGMMVADERAKKEKELEERMKENERRLESWYKWKDDMERQVIQTLSSQEDPNIFKEMKKTAIANYKATTKPSPSRGQIRTFSLEIDGEREVYINSRKVVTDQIAQNSEEIVDVIADVLQQQDEDRTALLDKGSDERMELIDAFTTRLKDYIKKFTEEQDKLDEEDRKVEEQAQKVADMVEEKQDELEDEAEDIAELKGYSECKTNAKSEEQLRAEALEELEDEQEDLEEAQAQGTVPLQGLGKRYKKYNKNSIANQVYLLNMKYINSF